MSSSTPVKVPAAASNYSAATLDPDLRSQINATMLRDGHVTKIQEHMLHALHSHQSNWPTVIQNHALTLLRSGEVTTFSALLRRVIDDVRNESLVTNGAADADASRKSAATNGSDGAPDSIVASSTGPASNLALPQQVLDEALRATKDCLEQICDVEES